MKNRIIYLGCTFTALLFTSFNGVKTNQKQVGVIDETYLDEQGNLLEPMDIATHQENKAPTDPYNEGVVLVKSHYEQDFENIDLDIASIEELYPNSPWKKITLNSGSSFDAINYLRNNSHFEKVDYDYIMTGEEIIESLDVSTNPYAQDLPYIDTSCIGWAWWWPHFPGHGGQEQNYEEAEPDDVIVAVIDTGVDYNHVDLRNNIWTNTGEIPNNQIDDDGNGYIDDVRGWDCVNEDNDPMDDNGHGTHVAGIVAAEDNDIGTVGVAFNAKVMPIKAATSSGSFSNADIAQAIQYAYMNGASVINMSFGGPSISVVVEDALSDAYNQCVLVAAAGNSGMCNQPGCKYHMPDCAPFYPAALPYVVGVMSCSENGTSISGFSNFDHYGYNEYEYDCYACGEQIVSLWPGNKYARMSGTSMSSPVVAGIAALIRSANPDRETCSTKYIHSQLTNAGTIFPSGDTSHPVCDAYEALTKVPKPHIYNLYRWYAFDNVEFDPSTNNGDGFIDAGETIRLGIELQNRGGKATNINAKIDTIQNGDPNLVDPNVNILQDTIHLDEIGTYSIQDGGKIYDGDKVINMTNAFVIKVSPDAQNGYECVFNLNVEYYNGLENDNTKYIGSCSFSITINKGFRISGIISEDTVFTSDKSYIIDNTVTIPEGVTVTFEEGCLVEFYSNAAGYIDTLYTTPKIEVYGSLYFRGTKNNMITLRPASNFFGYSYFITQVTSTSHVHIDYANVYNLTTESGISGHHIDLISNSNYSLEKSNRNGYLDFGWKHIVRGETDNSGWNFNMNEIENCNINLINAYGNSIYTKKIKNSFIQLGQIGTELIINCSYIYGTTDFANEVKNNVFTFNQTRAGENNRYGSILSFLVPTDYYGQSLIQNNSFVTTYKCSSLKELPTISFVRDQNSLPVLSEGNVFASIYQEFSDTLFEGLIDPYGEYLININDVANHDDSILWPYIKNIEILDSHNNVVHTVGTEQNKVKVTFSREMDITNDFSLFFGSWYPYSDYEIKGNYVSDTVWEGTLKVKANIEGGIQYFSSNGGCAKDDSQKILVDNSGAFTFNIDTSSAFAMNLQANSTEQGIELTWVQDDYDTLMGYNIYRSESKDGNFVRINPSVIPANENTFFDDSCEPGKTYWYTFTVVLSDLSESAPAGKVSATAVDTIAPVIYHTPVNQGYEGNNLVVNCTISDNIGVTGATLFYRSIGDVDWKSTPMSKANNRFSATIFGSEVTMAGLEYYISATDGHNTITRGSTDSPFTVVVKDASVLNNLGDVDGDGTITTKDALMIIRSINEELILTDDEFRRADLNKDTVLSTFEALRILQYINGNVTTLEM